MKDIAYYDNATKNYHKELVNYFIDYLKKEYETNYKTSADYQGETFEEIIDTYYFSMGNDSRDYSMDLISDFMISKMGNQYVVLNYNFVDSINDYYNLSEYLYSEVVLKALEKEIK
jgi:hypothetical protein